GDVGVLGNTKVSAGSCDEILVILDRTGLLERPHHLPTVLLQRPVRPRPTLGKDKTMRGSSRQRSEPLEFPVLVAVNATTVGHTPPRAPFQQPGYGQAAGSGGWIPQVSGNHWASRYPRAPCCRDGAVGHADPHAITE